MIQYEEKAERRLHAIGQALSPGGDGKETCAGASKEGRD